MTDQDFPSAPKTHIFTCTVVGVHMVSTVLGLMEVYEVDETENCAPLPVESVSWGTVKELYR